MATFVIKLGDSDEAKACCKGDAASSSYRLRAGIIAHFLVLVRMPKKIGALVIGQSPRLDLTAPLEAAFPECEIICGGALDGIPARAIPNVAEDFAGCAYPLITRLRDGTVVRVEEHELEPLLQEALERLEMKGVDATILLCAGSFASVAGSKPLIKPYTAAIAAIKSLHLTHLAVLCPEGQEDAIRKHWLEADTHVANVETIVIDMEPAEGSMGQNEQKALATMLLSGKNERSTQCVVIDYVGQHALSKAALAQLSQQAMLPVLDMQDLALNMLRAVLPVPAPEDDDEGNGFSAGIIEEGDGSTCEVQESGAWKGEGAQYHHMHDNTLAAALHAFFAKESQEKEVTVVDLGCGMGQYVKHLQVVSCRVMSCSEVVLILLLFYFVYVYVCFVCDFSGGRGCGSRVRWESRSGECSVKHVKACRLICKKNICKIISSMQMQNN